MCISFDTEIIYLMEVNDQKKGSIKAKIIGDGLFIFLFLRYQRIGNKADAHQPGHTTIRECDGIALCRKNRWIWRIQRSTGWLLWTDAQRNKQNQENSIKNDYKKMGKKRKSESEFWATKMIMFGPEEATWKGTSFPSLRRRWTMSVKRYVLRQIWRMFLFSFAPFFSSS